VLDAPVTIAPVSIRPGSRAHQQTQAPGPEAAAGNQTLAAQLAAIPGVAGVLLHPTWLTISKVPGASWPPIKSALERALADAAPVGAAP
jgi:hypothetical protein